MPETPYALHWSGLSAKKAAIGSVAVSLALVGGVALGHPEAGIIIGSGATTVAFSTSMQLENSYLRTMVAATMAMTFSTFVGMFAGHHGFSLLLVAAVWSFTAGMLIITSPTKGWIAQQAALTVMVTSAFPANLHDASERAMLTLSGGLLQICFTVLLRQDWMEAITTLHAIPASLAILWSRLWSGLTLDRLGRGLRGVPRIVPILARSNAIRFATRLVITTVVATEIYRWRGAQSGYWIPTTALLVQRPEATDTRDRMLLRTAGTLVGAGLLTQLLVHLRPSALVVAGLTILCCFGALLFRTVNYGVFSFLMTSYLVSLLSLTARPIPDIAVQRSVDTVLGGCLAIIFHLNKWRSETSEGHI
ncbi:hypothetical protein MMC10_011304 [Thelotrema lepadinum]|nr:hypothetical protein [Thelotrema lepadinum]